MTDIRSKGTKTDMEMFHEYIKLLRDPSYTETNQDLRKLYEAELPEGLTEKAQRDVLISIIRDGWMGREKDDQLYCVRYSFRWSRYALLSTCTLLAVDLYLKFT